jgi:hypothetical protein
VAGTPGGNMSEIRTPLPGLPHLERNRAARRGSALLYVIASIVLLGSVGAGVAYFSSSSSTSQISQSQSQSSYYAAIAGCEYFRALDETDRSAIAAMDISSRKFTLAGTSFAFTQVEQDAGNWYITSVGQSQSSNTRESNYIIGQVVEKKFSGIQKETLGMSGENTPDGKKAFDSSDYANHGEFKGKNSNAVKQVNGVYNNAFLFSSTNRGRVVYSFNEAYNIFYEGTIMFFMKPDKLNPYAGILHKGISSITCNNGIYADEVYTLQFWPKNNKIYLRMVLIEGNENKNCQSNDATCLCANDTTWRYIYADSKTAINVDTWYHVAVVWRKQTSGNLVVDIYINGSLDSTANIGSFTPRKNEAAVIVGGQSDSNSATENAFFSGLLDELIVYSTEIEQKSPKKCAALIICETFKEKRADFCEDNKKISMCKANPQCDYDLLCGS